MFIRRSAVYQMCVMYVHLNEHILIFQNKKSAVFLPNNIRTCTYVDPPFIKFKLFFKDSFYI